MARVYHLVLFKFKPGSDAQISEMARRLLQLPAAIGSNHVVSLTFGKNFSPARAKGFEYALTAILASSESLEIYAKHPAHQAVLKECVAPILEDSCAVDYLFPQQAM